MTRYLLRRVVRTFLLVVAVTLVVFLVTHVISDPARQMLPLDASEEEIRAVREDLGLARPLGTQFGDFVTGAAQLDFGESFWQGRDSLDLVLSRVPRTFLLVGSGVGVAVLIGVPAGTAMGVSRRRWLDRLGSTLSLVALSVPQFWLGLLLIMWFSLQLGWLPTSGYGEPAHLVLPALTLALPTAGRTAQITRATVRDELGEAYVRSAYGRGLSRARVTYHALRNAAVPITTLVGWETITALAGYTILVEVVFAWPGLGQLVVEAVSRQDLPLTEAAVVVTATIVVVANLAVDLLYRALDPRIELAR